YAKNVIDHLKSCKVAVTEGLSSEEFTSIESSFNFKFPPDLRSILSEGLPVGPGFPNWRSSSIQQLEILINLPVWGILKEISKKNFWCDSWGNEPEERDEALGIANKFLNNSPILVPIYKYCYICSIPNLAGNPVFYIHKGDLRYLGFDVAGFFQQIEFRSKNVVIRPVRVKTTTSNHHPSSIKAPAWAAKTARRIEFWSDMVEFGKCGNTSNNGNATNGKWRRVLGLSDFFEEISWKLKDGGWNDEEVKEMIVTEENDEVKKRVVRLKDKKSVAWHVKFLSLSLLRAGWSKEDVVYSFGFGEDDDGVVLPDVNTDSSLMNVQDTNSNSLQAHLMLLPP
ncbi:Atp-dependent 6-phosphofructokinase, partial [Thalictrum thalictroides]